MTLETEGFRFAAIQYCGATFIGPNHLVILDKIRELHPEVNVRNCVDGFIMTTERFLGRQDAKRVAHQLGVLRPGRDKFVCPELYSEFLIHDTLTPTDFKEMTPA